MSSTFSKKYIATYTLQSVGLESSAVALSNHVGQLEILGLHVSLHALHLVDAFLRRVGLECGLLLLAEQVEVLCAELSVELGQGLVLLPPVSDLLLQRPDHFVFSGKLSLDVGANAGEFGFQRFNALQAKKKKKR